MIFDLDDTLYAEKEYVHSGYRAVAAYLGDESLAEEMWNYFKEGSMAIDACLERMGKKELSAECVTVYREHKPKIHLYDGVRELIELLKEGGIKTGIITDGRPYGQRRKLVALGLDKMVGDIIITDVNREFSYMVPQAVGGELASFGFGDRLGIAGESHLSAVEGTGVKPVLAQQSLRELTLTGR